MTAVLDPRTGRAAATAAAVAALPAAQRRLDHAVAEFDAALDAGRPRLELARCDTEVRLATAALDALTCALRSTAADTAALSG